MERGTLESFVSKASALHKNKYDYSKVEYVNNKTKVKIICPVHGEFECTPHNHLKGRGCPLCAKNHKNTQEDFIAKANEVHNNFYDYSLVKFTKNADKVTIICPEHGPFEQVANSHLMGHGCPECGKIKLADSDYESRVETRKNTCIERYGVDNPMKDDSIKESQKSTIREKYGVDNVAALDSVKTKRKNTCIERFGSESYLGSDIGQEQLKAQMVAKYGVENYMQSSDAQIDKAERLEKSKTTQIKRYGADHYSKSDDFKSHLAERKSKEFNNKRENGTLNTSKPEEKLYAMLCDKFGYDDVIRQYKSDEYPYACDFYVKSRNMYIELNASWTHGSHWFSTENDDDMNIVNMWHEKGTDYYHNAYIVWTGRDVAKRQVAKKHNLNYVVFWDSELNDAIIWFSMDCPDGHDYDREYSWLPEKDLDVRPKQNTLSNLIKKYQQDAFYETEKALWIENPYHNKIPLQMYLYINRMKYLGKNPNQINAFELLRGFTISGIYKGFTVFNPFLMEQVIDKYHIKSVYDPCAGWGERLMTCHNKDVTYLGVDINEKLFDGYHRMIDDFDMKKQTVVNADSSDIVLDYKADAVITCPPYFNTEMYSDRGAENLSYDKFLDWWRSVVISSKQTKCKYFCFQINQKYKTDMKFVVESCGFKFVEELVLSKQASHFNKQTKKEFESMLVFKTC